MKAAKNGQNGRSKKRAPAGRATARQQAAREKYLKLTGLRVSRERIQEIRAEWQG